MIRRGIGAIAVAYVARGAIGGMREIARGASSASTHALSGVVLAFDQLYEELGHGMRARAAVIALVTERKEQRPSPCHMCGKIHSGPEKSQAKEGMN